MSIRSIITRFGGIRPMAEKLGHRSHTTVQGWWDREVIPAQRQREVLDAARRLDLGVNAEDLIAAVPTVALCAHCEIRAEDHRVGCCTSTQCPLRAREAA